jgi:hypothetical protein
MDLDELRARIAARMEQGASVDEVDELVIGPSSFEEDEKAALWLYAWSYVPIAKQRYEAKQTLAHLGARGRVPEPVYTGD